jgi:hypothetical protein
MQLNDDIVRMYELQSKQKVLLSSQNGLLNYYKNEVNKRIFLSVVRQKTSISLRLLEHLVTNYAKTHNVHYELSNAPVQEGSVTSERYINSSKHFNMHLDYKNQLKSYNKRLFDPFKRRQKIRVNFTTNDIQVLTYDDEEVDPEDEDDENENEIVTTVGQLNFFAWAIENKVIDYAFENIEKIESDMLSSADKRKMKKVGKRQLSKNNSCAKSQKTKLIVQFN